MFNAIGCYN
ncbi:23S rRNA (uracil-5-)-methyltransferase RumB, partial [Yersinia pestis PY-42]